MLIFFLFRVLWANAILIVAVANKFLKITITYTTRSDSDDFQNDFLMQKKEKKT